MKVLKSEKFIQRFPKKVADCFLQRGNGAGGVEFSSP
jgi:hypothetical protein